MKFSIIDGRSPRTIHYSIQFKALFRVDINHTYNTSSNEFMYVLYKLIIKNCHIYSFTIKKNKIRSQKLMTTNMDSTIAGSVNG